MTEPLCDEPDAEQTCEQHLRTALEVNPENLDALQTLAQIRLLRQRDNDAKQALQKVVERTLQILKVNAEDQTVGAIATNKKSSTQETPSLDFRMQTCRFLIELAQWKNAVKILESVTSEDDERIEAWYLLAFALFRLNKYATAEECCANVRNLIIKFKVADPELESGTLEIYNEIQKIKQKGKQAEQEDEEWATDSEEDVDGDGDEEMKE